MKSIVKLQKIISFFADFTLAGLIQFTYLKIRRKVLVVQGSCNCCGNCCRAINLEGPKGWIKSEKYFQSLLERNQEFSRFSVLKKDKSGHIVFECSMLGENNMCTDYDNRPIVCRFFPDNRLPFCGGGLPEGCGYMFKEMKSFEHFLKKKLERNIK